MTDDAAERSPATQLVDAGRREEWTGAAVNPPTWRASTILYPNCAALAAGEGKNRDGEWFYGRRGTPTQWALAEALTELEPGAAGTMLYPSGVAAIAGALLSVLKPGDECVMHDTVYGPARGLADGLLRDWGVTTRFADPMGPLPLSERTRAVLLETPGSLTMEVPDLPAQCAAAKAAGVAVVLDNTWTSGHLLKALPLGVDLSVVAVTKHIGGHSDLMMGAVTATPARWPALRRLAQALGQTVSADDATLALRGLRTLDLRLARQGETGLVIARWLARHPGVETVLHPALPSCPGHEWFARDFVGPCGLFSFVLAPEWGAAHRAALIDGLARFGIGYSWGGYESLAIPCDPVRTVRPWDRPGRLVRLSIGLDDAGDLIADLARSFASAAP